MTALCYTLLENSFGAGVLILAVLLLRPFLRGQANVRCVLWALVAVRLLCPVLPDSSFGVIPHGDVAMEMVSSALQSTQTEAGESEPGEQGTVLLPAVETNPGEGQKNPPVSAAENPEKGEPLRVLSFLWLAGTAGMLAYLVVSYGRTRRETAISVPLADGVLLCDGIDTPFLFGLLRPVICIPSAMEEANLPHVLAHERAHLKRRDHWWKLLGFILLSVYWFHPLVWLAYLLFCRDLELACDQRVIRDMDGEGRKGYASSLLSCGVSRLPRPACPLAFGEVGVKTRIRGVARYRKPKLWAILGAALVCALAAVCFLTNATRLTPAMEAALEEQNCSLDEKYGTLLASDSKVLSVERTEYGFKLYTVTATSAYDLSDLEKEDNWAGGGSIGPVILSFTVNEETGYTHTNSWWAGDGSRYWTDVQPHFPLWDRLRLRLFYGYGSYVSGIFARCDEKALACYEALSPDTVLGYTRYGYLTPAEGGFLFREAEYICDEQDAEFRAGELGALDFFTEHGYYVHDLETEPQWVAPAPGRWYILPDYRNEVLTDDAVFTAYLQSREEPPLFRVILQREKGGTQWLGLLGATEIELS